jgi:hypothetical protein
MTTGSDEERVPGQAEVGVPLDGSAAAANGGAGGPRRIVSAGPVACGRMPMLNIVSDRPVRAMSGSQTHLAEKPRPTDLTPDVVLDEQAMPVPSAPSLRRAVWMALHATRNDVAFFDGGPGGREGRSAVRTTRGLREAAAAGA